MKCVFVFIVVFMADNLLLISRSLVYTYTSGAQLCALASDEYISFIDTIISLFRQRPTCVQANDKKRGVLGPHELSNMPSKLLEVFLLVSVTTAYFSRQK